MIFDGVEPLLLDLVVTIPDIILLLPDQSLKELSQRDHGLYLPINGKHRVILKSVGELDRLNHRVIVELWHERFAFLTLFRLLL